MKVREGEARSCRYRIGYHDDGTVSLVLKLTRADLRPSKGRASFVALRLDESTGIRVNCDGQAVLLKFSIDLSAELTEAQLLDRQTQVAVLSVPSTE